MNALFDMKTLAAIALTALAAVPQAQAAPREAVAADVPESPRILTDRNSVLILIDHQPQTMFGVASHDRQTIVNNVEALARTARAFNLPVVLTTVAADSFTGALLPEIARHFPGQEVIDRTTLNAWADPRVVEAVKKTGRTKLIMAGAWTELCLTLPVLSALQAGYEVYFVPDASGGSSPEAHQLGIQRMIQAGATPVTWVGVASELQYDWARKDTYEAVNQIFMEHGGAFGAGITYRRELNRRMTAK
jgi:nicotinamidase-related amidase